MFSFKKIFVFTMDFFFWYQFLFFAHVPRGMQDLIPQSGIEPVPLQRKPVVLTTQPTREVSP